MGGGKMAEAPMADATATAPWLGKTVRLSDRQGGRIGTVESSANGYYLVRLRDKVQGEIKVRGAELTAISTAEAEEVSDEEEAEKASEEEEDEEDEEDEDEEDQEDQEDQEDEEDDEDEDDEDDEDEDDEDDDEGRAAAATATAPWLGKTVRLGERQGSQIGVVESSANGYYLVRLRDNDTVKVRASPDLTCTM